MKAIETTGHIDHEGKLQIKHPLALTNRQVKIIVLVPEGDDIQDDEWLQTVGTSDSFDFLNEPEEDIYTLADGKPVLFSN